MTAPREVKNNIIIAQGGSLKTANGVYANNAYFGGIQPPASPKRVPSSATRSSSRRAAAS